MSLSLANFDNRVSVNQRVEIPFYGAGRSPIHNYWVQNNQTFARKLLRPLAYSVGMVGYSLSILPRIGGVVKDAFMLVITLFYAVGQKFNEDSCKGLKVRLFVLGASCLEVGSAFVGVLCPPLAYKIDDYLNTFYWVNVLSFFSYGNATSSYSQQIERERRNVQASNRLFENQVVEADRSFFLDPTESDPELIDDVRHHQMMQELQSQNSFNPTRNLEIAQPTNSRPLMTRELLIAVLEHIYLEDQMETQNANYNDDYNDYFDEYLDPSIVDLSNNQLSIDAENRLKKLINLDLFVENGKKAFQFLEQYTDHSYCNHHMHLFVECLFIDLFLCNQSGEITKLFDAMIAPLRENGQKLYDIQKNGSSTTIEKDIQQYLKKLQLLTILQCQIKDFATAFNTLTKGSSEKIDDIGKYIKYRVLMNFFHQSTQEKEGLTIQANDEEIGKLAESMKTLESHLEQELLVTLLDDIKELSSAYANVEDRSVFTIVYKKACS